MNVTTITFISISAVLLLLAIAYLILQIRLLGTKSAPELLAAGNVVIGVVSVATASYLYGTNSTHQFAYLLLLGGIGCLVVARTIEYWAD